MMEDEMNSVIRYLTAEIEKLEKRISQLEEQIRHMADVGDTLTVEQHIHGDMYRQMSITINEIHKAESEDKNDKDN